MKKILVTGGLGYIGSHVVVELQKNGFEVVIIDDLSNSSKDVLDGIYKITGVKPYFEKVDMKSKKSLMVFLINIPILRELSILLLKKQLVKALKIL